MARICVIGIGDAGIKMADRVPAGAGEDVVRIAINTDRRSLERSSAAVKLAIGAARTGGLGTGGDVETGRLAAEDDEHLIRESVSGADMILAAVGLGGGCGTGAASVVLRNAGETGAITFLFATLPFPFEGPQAREAADHALAELQKQAGIVLAIPNERMASFVGDGKVADTFDGVNRVIGSGIGALYRLITKPGYLNLDLPALRKCLGGENGLGSMAVAEAEGAGRGEQIVRQLVDNPMTDSGAALTGARSILVGILGGRDLAIQDVGTVFAAVKERAPRDCPMWTGTAIDDDWNGRITAVLIFTDRWKDVGEQAQLNHGRSLLAAKKTQRGQKAEQGRFSFEPFDRGRFKDVDPTIQDGIDLDEPTYCRRRIRIEK